MPYFKEFPKLLYSTSLGLKNFKSVTNIFANVKFLRDILLNTDVYYTYDVKDGERPEDIAHKLYKDSEKHWIILLANNIVDPQYDWVMGQQQFDSYINKKYSSVTVQLPTTDGYASDYILNEVVYQGDSLSNSSVMAQVASFNSGTKTLQLKFLSQTIANVEMITGVTSLESHKINSVTINNDGYNWASNTAAHYSVTEVKYNSYDKTKTTTNYNVSSYDYNFANDSINARPLGTTTTSTLLQDGTTLYIETTVATKSYYDVEVDQNEAKRKIKIPKAEYVTVIDQQFKRLMRNL